MRSRTIYLFAIAGALVLFVSADALSVSNLSKSCLQCLCYAATNCSLKIPPSGGYAGPFWISRIYWFDAGNHTLETDDPLRDQAYNDCAKDYNCASVIVIKYMQRNGKDCNKDGITDCDDFAQIHYWGPDCDNSPQGINVSHKFWKRYLHCQKTALAANPLL